MVLVVTPGRHDACSSKILFQWNGFIRTKCCMPVVVRIVRFFTAPRHFLGEITFLSFFTGCYASLKDISVVSRNCGFNISAVIYREFCDLYCIRENFCIVCLNSLKLDCQIFPREPLWCSQIGVPNQV